LVTHHLDLVVPVAQYLVRMLDGRIELQGDIFDLRRQGSLKQFMPVSTSSEARTGASSGVADHSREEANGNPKGGTNQIKEVETENKRKNVRRLVENEKIAEGNVNLSVYRSYLNAS
jgi:ABC-type multidrug transport system ATPase subunit